jgi:cardiolipin synthase (CMP-forming)
MKGTGESAPASSAILTIPNLLSALRILAIPFFCYLIVHRPTTFSGVIMFAVVVATDWVDGWIARRTGQVSELGKILDPVADRLAIAAGLIALVARGAFPLWAALLILVRDGAILIGGALLLAGRRVRIDVRKIGKAATFALMTAIPWISWGHLHYPLATPVLVGGWIAYAIGIVTYYVAAYLYVGDIRAVVAQP